MELDLAISTKKDTILEKINKRNKDRQNYLEAQLQSRHKEHHEIEGVDFFVQTFSDHVKSIDNNISNLKCGNKVELTMQFEDINNEIQELQRYLSQSTMFLPDYNIKACQNILNDLNTRAEEVRLKLIPKKKFGFNKKNENPVILSSPKKLNSTKVKSEDRISLHETKLKTNEFKWTLSKRQNEFILLIDSEVNNRDLTMSNLENCFVEVKGHGGSLQISNAKNTTFLCGPISRSLFAEDCVNCTFVVACQQLRLHSSINCTLWIHVTCRAIIEDCSEINVGKYNYEYPEIEIDFNKAGLDRNINNFKDIADFNWLSPDQASPNWKLICENKEIRTDWFKVKEKFEEKVLKV